MFRKLDSYTTNARATPTMSIVIFPLVASVKHPKNKRIVNKEGRRSNEFLALRHISTQ